MYTNELIFLLMALLEFTFIVLSFRMGKTILHCLIVTNILLISTFGVKTVSVFSFETNIGNIFYASVFFIFHILAEHYGPKEAKKAIWIGATATALFVILGQLTLFLTDNRENTATVISIKNILSKTPRLALASIFPYIIIQIFNVVFYDYLHKKTGRKFLWLRTNLANITGQFLDSILFFFIAFFGILSLGAVYEVMLVGYAMKVAAGILATPFLYLTYKLKRVIQT